MRNLLALLAALVLAFVGIGWYLGWYQVKTEPAILSGHQKVDIDINSDKIVTDVKKGKEMVNEMRKNAAANLPDSTPSSAPAVVTPHE
jgi:hypothetical protein